MTGKTRAGVFEARASHLKHACATPTRQRGGGHALRIAVCEDVEGLVEQVELEHERGEQAHDVAVRPRGEDQHPRFVTRGGDALGAVGVGRCRRGGRARSRPSRPGRACRRRRSWRPARHGSCSSMRSPSSRARALSPSRSITSMAASAAAHDTGLPPNVLPSPPTCTASMTSARPGDTRDRHASAEPFRGRDEVGHDALVLAREPRARAAEAGLHLVGDEQHAVRHRTSARGLRTQPASGTTNPPSPAIGSTITHAT